MSEICPNTPAETVQLRPKAATAILKAFLRFFGGGRCMLRAEVPS